MNIKEFVFLGLSTHADWIRKFDQRLSRSSVLQLVESLHVRHDIPCLLVVDWFGQLSLRGYVWSLLIHQLLLLTMLSLVVIGLLLMLLLLLLILLLLLVLLLLLLLLLLLVLLLLLLLLILLLGDLRSLLLHLRNAIEEFLQEYLNLARLP